MNQMQLNFPSKIFKLKLFRERGVSGGRVNLHIKWMGVGGGREGGKEEQGREGGGEGGGGREEREG